MRYLTRSRSVSDEGVRLQKVLAAAGLGSRRTCENLIIAGRVEVDGTVVTELGTRIDPLTAVVRVDGQRVVTAPDTVVLLLNKPRGVVSTMSDDRGRPCVGDLVADRPERVFHVGRLDAETSGLLVLTNDGELANRLAHPRHGVEKTYVATVRGDLSKEAERALRSGVELDDGPAACDAVRVRARAEGKTQVEVVLHEGRNRIVRRMFDAVGFPVIDLVRTRFGPLHVGGLKSGAIRELKPEEVRALYTVVGL